LKKKILILSVSLIATYAISQSSINKKPKEMVSKVKTIEDTVKVELQKKSTILPVQTKENAKLIMVKETMEADYWKYIFPVITLILGIFLNKFIDFISAKKNTKRNGKTWTAELIGLEASLNSQKEALIKFKNTFANNNFEIEVLKIYGDLDGKSFDFLEKSELLKYIEARYGNWQPSIIIGNQKENESFKAFVKTTNKIIGYIDIVKFNFNLITEKHSSFLNGISTNTTILNKHIHDFRDALAQYQIELEREVGIDINTDARLRPINLTFKREIMDKMANKTFNPLLLSEIFCQPILETLAITREDVRTNSLRLLCTAILNAVEALKAERTYMETNLNTLIDRFEELENTLPSIINLLNSEKLPD
jgi:hypothetical protein